MDHPDKPAGERVSTAPPVDTYRLRLEHVHLPTTVAEADAAIAVAEAVLASTERRIPMADDLAHAQRITAARDGWAQKHAELRYARVRLVAGDPIDLNTRAPPFVGYNAVRSPVTPEEADAALALIRAKLASVVAARKGFTRGRDEVSLEGAERKWTERLAEMGYMAARLRAGDPPEHDDYARAIRQVAHLNRDRALLQARLVAAMALLHGPRPEPATKLVKAQPTPEERDELTRLRDAVQASNRGLEGLKTELRSWQDQARTAVRTRHELIARLMDALDGPDPWENLKATVLKVSGELPAGFRAVYRARGKP